MIPAGTATDSQRVNAVSQMYTELNIDGVESQECYGNVTLQTAFNIRRNVRVVSPSETRWRRDSRTLP